MNRTYSVRIKLNFLAKSDVYSVQRNRDLMQATISSQIPIKSQGSGLATASLVLAIVSLPLTILCFSGVLTAILAITLGHVALRRTRRSANTLPTKNKAIVGLVISYLYLGFAIVLFGIVVTNRVSKIRFSDDSGMNFTIHTPLKGTSYEWQIKHRAPLVVVMAPRDVQVSTLPDVALPIAPQNPRDFQYLSINMIPKKYSGNVADVARQLISGTSTFDKDYSADDPEPFTISGIPSSLFRESLVINGSHAKGIAFLVSCTHGYYLLTFRCDPNSYDESFYKRIAGTFEPK